jgi:hypothetical protein
MGAVGRIRTSRRFSRTKGGLRDEKVAPLAKGGVAFLFEANSVINMCFEVEVIVH